MTADLHPAKGAGPGRSDADGDRAAFSDDHLATTRMPPIGLAPLPPPRVPPSHPPPAVPQTPHPSTAAVSPSAPESAPPRAVDAQAPPAQSAWRAFLASALPRAALTSEAEPERLRARLAVTCVAFGIGSIVFALVMAVRAAPSEFFMPSALAASIVLSRALLAVGFLGAGLALLRAAERLYFR